MDETDQMVGDAPKIWLELERVRGLGKGGEGGEDVELLDGWVSALEEGDRVVVVMLICTGLFVFIIFLFRIL